MTIISLKTEWLRRKLGEMAVEVRDLFEPKGGEEYSYVGLEHIEQGTLQLGSIGSSADTVSTKKRFKSGEILFGSLRPYFRKVVRPKFNGVCSTDITVIRPKKECDCGFLKYFIANQPFIDHATNISSGTRMPRANWKTLCESTWWFPPLPTQRKIAAILSAYDDLIENNLRRIRILEEMAQNLYREWFVKFRFPACAELPVVPDTAQAAASAGRPGHQNARFVDSPLGRIPEGWEMAELGGFANQIRDSVNPNSVNPDTPYIGLEHLPRKSISVYDWGRAGDVQSTKLIFKKGDILFGKIRPYFHKVGVAPFSGICSSDTIVIRPKTANLFGLILGCTSSSEFVEHATATSQGTKMPRANWDVLVKYQIPMPPPPILSQLNEFIVEIVSQIHNFIFRIQNLRRTRDLLLPKLISGEVDVSELDISVPEDAA